MDANRGQRCEPFDTLGNAFLLLALAERIETFAVSCLNDVGLLLGPQGGPSARTWPPVLYPSAIFSGGLAVYQLGYLIGAAFLPPLSSARAPTPLAAPRYHFEE